MCVCVCVCVCVREREREMCWGEGGWGNEGSRLVGGLCLNKTGVPVRRGGI